MEDKLINILKCVNYSEKFAIEAVIFLYVFFFIDRSVYMRLFENIFEILLTRIFDPPHKIWRIKTQNKLRNHFLLDY